MELEPAKSKVCTRKAWLPTLNGKPQSTCPDCGEIGLLHFVMGMKIGYTHKDYVHKT